jgi:hypothetical protein
MDVAKSQIIHDFFVQESQRTIGRTVEAGQKRSLAQATENNGSSLETNHEEPEVAEDSKRQR